DLFGDAPVKPQPRPVTATDRVRAAAAGVNKGFFSDLVGLPVDTVTNVLDLAKAGVGFAYNEGKQLATGKPSAAPEWSEPFDRSKVVGSSEWIAAKINAGGLGAAINNPNPQDAASRVLHTSGRFAGASVVPSSRVAMSGKTQLANAGMGAVSGLASGSVAEVAPEWAGVAGMLPTVGVAGAAAATKRVVRGGEAGRQKMAQRMQDLKAGGIEAPSVGLASGNRTIMGLENLLAQTPFSAGLYERAGQANIGGMRAKTDALRDSISTEFGPVVAGGAIQSALKDGFRGRINATTKTLNDRVANLVGTDTVVPVDATLAKAGKLSTPTKGAEATTADLITPRISRIASNLKADVHGVLPKSALPLKGDPTRNAALTPKVPQTSVNNSGLMNTPVVPNNPLPQASVPARARPPVVIDSLTNLPKGAASLPRLAQRTGPNPTLNLPMSRPVPQEVVSNPSIWNTPVMPREALPQRAQSIAEQPIPNASIWNAQKERGIPFGALKALRTSIGEEASSPLILGTPESAQFKQLYGAMSDDMRQAAAAADRRVAGVGVGPLLSSQQPATIALNRANRFYSRGATRSEDLNGIANRSTPEGAYGAVTTSLNSGPTLYSKLRGAVDPATRQKLVATIIDDMGMAKPGQQGVDGDVWSPRTFLTNYSKLHQNGGGKELFKRLPGGEKHAQELASIAKTAEMLGDASMIWANPSGTAPALTARGTAYTLTAGAFFQPLLAASTAGGLVGAHQVSQRLLLNPKFTRWLVQGESVKPAQVRAHAQRLIVTANITRDEQFKRDAAEYLRLVEQGQQEQYEGGAEAD
ncbi:hypothetical protein, partial [Agrobacterium tumefaciens]|uniref:hypothetical protein n=1 Tax=Agrobacterium tumefaciens TaxID=358 RepID=UPI0015746C1C